MASGLDNLGPAGFGWAVTASDSADLATETRAIYVGVGGDIACHMYDPTTQKRTAVTLKNVPSGSFLPAKTWRILSTGTTATDIVAWA